MSVYIGLAKDEVALVRFAEIDAAAAREQLTTLVGLYHLGQTLPLCFFTRSSYAYARTMLAKKDDKAAAAAARTEFLGGGGDSKNGVRPESDDPYVDKVLAGRDPVEPGFHLLDPASPGAAEEPAFATLALDIFGPLLAHREKG